MPLSGEGGGFKFSDRFCVEKSQESFVTCAVSDVIQYRSQVWGLPGFIFCFFSWGEGEGRGSLAIYCADDIRMVGTWAHDSLEKEVAVVKKCALLIFPMLSSVRW